MLQRKLLVRTLSVLVSATLCFPAVAAESTLAKLKSKPRTAVELQMHTGGLIHGKVVNRQGKSLVNAEVKVLSKTGSATTKTDAKGFFAVKGLTVGEYVIGVGPRTQKVRVWNAQTAPPNTAQVALLVVGDTVRGQCCDTACGGCDSCAAPSCGAPAGCAAPACGVPAPSCGAPVSDCCDTAAPSCGIASPVCSPCDSIIPSCGPTCGGCDSCGSGCGGGGLFGGGGIGGGGASPILIGGAVAAAIAIPLAIDDDDDAS